MRAFMAWAGWNLVRFFAVWVAIATVVFCAVDFDAGDVVPHSALKVLFVPVALALILFIGAFSAIVALALIGPVVGLWLLVYLPALWWSQRLVSGSARRIVAVMLALAPLALLRTGDWAVEAAALSVAVAFGLVVRLPPTATRGAATSSRSSAARRPA